MSAAAELLARVSSLGIELRVDGDQLRVRPASRLPEDLREELRARRGELLRLLAGEAADATGDPQGAPAAGAEPWPAERIAAWWSRDGEGAAAYVRGYSRSLRRPVLLLGELAQPGSEDAGVLVVRPHLLRSVLEVAAVFPETRVYEVTATPDAPCPASAPFELFEPQESPS